jgi:hypothetical protein
LCFPELIKGTRNFRQVEIRFRVKPLISRFQLANNWIEEGSSVLEVTLEAQDEPSEHYTRQFPVAMFERGEGRLRNFALSERIREMSGLPVEIGDSILTPRKPDLIVFLLTPFV